MRSAAKQWSSVSSFPYQDPKHFPRGSIKLSLPHATQERSLLCQKPRYPHTHTDTDASILTSSESLD